MTSTSHPSGHPRRRNPGFRLLAISLLCLAGAVGFFRFQHHAGHADISASRHRPVAPEPTATPPASIPEPAPESGSSAPQVTAAAPVPRPAIPAPTATPRTNRLAPNLAGGLATRYGESRKREETAEAKLKEILARDPEVARITEMKVRQLSSTVRGIALAQEMDDPVFRAMFQDALQDPKVFADLRDIYQKSSDALGMGISFKDANSADEFVALLQRTEPFLRTSYDRVSAKLGVDDTMAVLIEDGASNAMTTRFIAGYMNDAGWRYDDASQSFQPGKQEPSKTNPATWMW